ncbi:RNA polymerase sigma factor [Candidatus Leptofilum sp.]|uniref:RNA polymerase sigma factor n=1 Tax=Candidatus Leptofilum sp. TaxID=3241576 RepID=UPI003B5B2BDD
MNVADETLMAQAAAGDSHALETLYDRYAPILLGVVLRIVQQRAVAEEIVQETFWRVWDKAATFDSAQGKFSTWMYSIGRRLAIDHTRRQKVRPEAASSEAEEEKMLREPDDADVVATADLRIEQARVRSALAALTPEQYQVIELAYFKGLTRKEIAQAIDKPLGTVHTRARLGLQKLRSALAAAGMES